MEAVRYGALLLLTVVAASLMGCLPREIQGPDPCNEGGTLLTDDFDGSKNCGWTLYEGSGASAEMADDVLRLSSSQPGKISWSNAGRNFDDLIITAKASQIAGPDDNAYGLICRYQSDENFYLFLISGDGYYAIGKYQSGNPQVQYLSGEGQFEFSEAINQGAVSNDIRASCIGDELSLSVNGVPLATVTDPTFVTGDLGLGVSTFQPGTAVVDFHSIQAIAP